MLRVYQIMALVLLVGVLSACNMANTSAQNSNTNPTSTAVPTAAVSDRPRYPVQRGTVQEEYSFRGRWQPRDQQQLYFETAGTIASVNVSRGDAVAAGDPLLGFDTTELQNQLANAQISLESAIAAQASEGEGGIEAVEDAEIALANSRLSLQNSQLSSPWPSLNNAELALETAERNLENARRNYYDAISRPEQDASVANSAYDQLASAEDAYQQALNGYYSAAQSFNSHQISTQQTENDVIRSEITRDRAVDDLATGNQNPDIRRAQLEVERIQQELDRAVLYALFAGIVQEVFVQPGDQVGAYEAVIVLALPEPKEIVASLPFNDTLRLSVGMVGVCEVLGQPDTRVGCVVRQVPLSNRDTDQTTRVAASFENVIENQVIDVSLPIETRENVLWLPPQVIRTFQNRTFVVIDTPEGPRTVDVVLGLQTDERIEIVSGVNEGDMVIAP